MEVRIRFYASPDYVEKHGLPATADELANHRLITHSPASPQVRAGADFVLPFLSSNAQSLLTVNSYFGILQGVMQGIGVGALPDYVITEGTNLVPVLPDDQSAPIPVYLAYVEELRHSKRITAFRDFMLEEITAYKRGADHAPALAVSR